MTHSLVALNHIKYHQECTKTHHVLGCKHPLKTSILTRDAMHRRGHAIGMCLSVCPSRSWTLSKQINIWYLQHFSPTIPLFAYQTPWQYSDGDPDNGDVECTWGSQKWRFSMNIWLSDTWLVKCEQQLRRSTVQLTIQTATHQWSLLSQPTQQELSYRKQIARQLRTQYVEGIHRPKYYTVTLKSRLRITQGHWKRNHWTDHTRLTINRVKVQLKFSLEGLEWYKDSLLKWKLATIITKFIAKLKSDNVQDRNKM